MNSCSRVGAQARAYLGGLHDAEELGDDGGHAPEVAWPLPPLRQRVEAFWHHVAPAWGGVRFMKCRARLSRAHDQHASLAISSQPIQSSRVTDRCEALYMSSIRGAKT